MKATEFVLRSIADLGVDHLFMFVGGLVDPFLPDHSHIEYGSGNDVDTPLEWAVIVAVGMHC